MKTIRLNYVSILGQPLLLALPKASGLLSLSGRCCMAKRHLSLDITSRRYLLPEQFLNPPLAKRLKQFQLVVRNVAHSYLLVSKGLSS